MEMQNNGNELMKSLNPLEVNLQKYLVNTLNTTLIGYTNKLGEKASFDDVVWTYITPAGTSINLYFFDTKKVDSNKKISLKTVKDSWKLDDSKRHLLMVYVLEIVSLKFSLVTIRKRAASARAFLSSLSYELHSLTQEQFDRRDDLLPCVHNAKLVPFIIWLKNKSFIPKNIKTKRSINSEYGYDRADKLIDKMPDEKVLLALGAICYEVIPPDENKWQASLLSSQRHALVCAMSALAMASPNRVAAEQVTLANQEIKTETLETGKRIHWLDWQGSKGYKNNQNHLVANMIEPLTRVLKYIRKITEPGRVLARFYENPESPLGSLLGEYTPESSRLNNANIDLDKPVHLLQLGYLIGFYDDDFEVSTAKQTPDARHNKGSQHLCKKIHLLSNTDRFLLSTGSSGSLLGVMIRKDHLLDIFGTNMMSSMIKVTDFQDCWIKHIKKNIPTFPYCHASGDNKCRFSSLMFSFTGQQVSVKGSGGVLGLKSFYHLVQGTTLSSLFSNLVSGNNRNQTIFEDFGFSREFSIRPHQFRHWLNDTGERAGVAHRIINLWSGRESPEQLLNYIHCTEGERASVVRDILFKNEKVDESNIQPIKVYSQSEYEVLVGIGDGISTATSTGFCIQNLLTSPCEYMNDFETQCSLCTSACHVKGDGVALELLQKDHKYQLQRLKNIESKPNFRHSERMQAWFQVHHRNTAMLKELIVLMNDPDIKQGSVIRVLASKSEIRITDLNLQLVDKRLLSLPCSKSALENIIDTISPAECDDDTFSNLLSMIPEV